MSRKQAASAAGVSKRQKDTMLRVARPIRATAIGSPTAWALTSPHQLSST